MRYFNTLPLIAQSDFNGNSILVNNLMARSYMLPSLQKNVMLFYEYDVKEVDTPENVAYRYYDDVNRFWLVLFSNNILDPQGEWPLTNNQFISFLDSKYGSAAANVNSTVLAYTSSTVHHYEELITTTDSENLQEQTISIIIDEDTYNNTLNETTVRTFPNGVQVSKTVSTKAVSIYDYENSLNETKRRIVIMKDEYAPDTEVQLKTLMGT
jgi:hypothetical protein